MSVWVPLTGFRLGEIPPRFRVVAIAAGFLAPQPVSHFVPYEADVYAGELRRTVIKFTSKPLRLLGVIGWLRSADLYCVPKTFSRVLERPGVPR